MFASNTIDITREIIELYGQERAVSRSGAGSSARPPVPKPAVPAAKPAAPPEVIKESVVKSASLFCRSWACSGAAGAAEKSVQGRRHQPPERDREHQRRAEGANDIQARFNPKKADLDKRQADIAQLQESAEPRRNT